MTNRTSIGPNKNSSSKIMNMIHQNFLNKKGKPESSFNSDSYRSTSRGSQRSKNSKKSITSYKTTLSGTLNRENHRRL